MKTCSAFFILLFLVAMAAFSAREALTSPDEKPTEYQVKAAFLYNFAKFVDWPSGSASEKAPSFNLCVLGQDPFGPCLDDLQGKIIRDKKVAIRRISTTKQLADCHILFISSAEKNQLTQILESLKGLKILTVSDAEGFAERGVAINFYMEENKVRFEINPHAVERAGLKISSNLMKLARVVRNPSK